MKPGDLVRLTAKVCYDSFVLHPGTLGIIKDSWPTPGSTMRYNGHLVEILDADWPVDEVVLYIGQYEVVENETG